MKNEKINRTIYFYNLDFVYLDTFTASDGNNFRKLFELLNKLSVNKEAIRYQTFGEKSLFIQDIKFDSGSQKLTAKLRCVRRDLLPELINTITDETKGIEVEDAEGIVDTTHFVIDYSKPKLKLAIEFNQFGAKIGDLVKYLQVVGKLKGAIDIVGFTPIVRDDLKSFQERIKRCSEFVVKVHKDNIEQIKKVDSNTYSALKATMKLFENEYSTLVLKFDYRNHKTTKVNRSIKNIITDLIKHKDHSAFFNTLSVRAEDGDNEDILNDFDLLLDKVKSEIKVLKKFRYKTVVSNDILEKMKNEMIKRRI